MAHNHGVFLAVGCGVEVDAGAGRVGGAVFAVGLRAQLQIVIGAQLFEGCGKVVTQQFGGEADNFLTGVAGQFAGAGVGVGDVAVGQVNPYDGVAALVQAELKGRFVTSGYHAGQVVFLAYGGTVNLADFHFIFYRLAAKKKAPGLPVRKLQVQGDFSGAGGPGQAGEEGSRFFFLAR